jgi:hypothetical protein
VQRRPLPLPPFLFLIDTLCGSNQLVVFGLSRPVHRTLRTVSHCGLVRNVAGCYNTSPTSSTHGILTHPTSHPQFTQSSNPTPPLSSWLGSHAWSGAANNRWGTPLAFDLTDRLWGRTGLDSVCGEGYIVQSDLSRRRDMTGGKEGGVIWRDMLRCCSSPDREMCAGKSQSPRHGSLLLSRHCLCL